MNPITPDTVYKGGAFHDSLPRGKAFGKITFTSDSLYFESSKGRTELPLQGVCIKNGGAGGRMIFFTHNSVPGWTLHTTDQRVLRDIHLSAFSDALPQTVRIRKAKRRSQMFVISFAVLCLIAIYMPFYFKEPLVSAAAGRIPAKWEQKFGQTALYQLKAEKGFVESPAIHDMLKQISEPVFHGISPKTSCQFTVYVMPDKSVNAFALPGGYIVLNTGLLMAAKSPEELAGVIAHEAAHIALQHGLKQMISSAGTYALFQSLFGDASGLIAVIADNSAFLLTRKYSRDYEREADDRAWDYLLAANIDPRGMTNFFHTLLAAQEKNNLNPLENALNFLSTHPTSRERIEHLQEKFKRLDDRAGYVSFPLDFKVFQDAIRNLASQEAAEP